MRTRIFRYVLSGALVLCALSAARTSADDSHSDGVSALVHFRPGQPAPSPLRQRLIQEGKSERDPAGPLLDGYLRRPTGEGPFPAAVLLHGCLGLGPSLTAFAEWLTRQGYITLAVDSFKPRGITETCSTHLPERPFDAYGALDLLAQRADVAPNKIVLVGFSAGGMATLAALQKDGIEGLFERKFRAAAAFYPICVGYSGMMAAPTLIMVGALDDWAPAKACTEIVKRGGDEGILAQLKIYPNARHSFDTPTLAADKWVNGHRLAYNPEAARAAYADLLSFLSEALASATP